MSRPRGTGHIYNQKQSWQRLLRLCPDRRGLCALLRSHTEDVFRVHPHCPGDGLEAMICTQTGGITIVLMSSLYSLISGGVQLLMILIGGVVLFHVDLSHMSILPTLLVLILSITIFMAFGVLSAAAIIWLKKGDPITWILGGFGSILGGAYFPTAVMPSWMQKISFIIPVRYSLDALRLTMLKGVSFATGRQPTMILALMAAILLPTSVAIFAGTVRKGRKEGTLMQY